MSEPASIPAPSSLRRLLAPSLVEIFFLFLLLVAFARPGGWQALLADGDTGWHVRTGELVLASGRVPLADPFSFSRAGHEWFAWEWMADVLFAWAYHGHGLGAVAALSAVVLCGAAAALLAWLLRRGAGLWVGLGVTLAAVSASSVHYLARPHVFSILFYALSLWLLDEDRRHAGRRLWLLPPLAAVWANLHGGFVILPATLALLAAVTWLERGFGGAKRYVLAALLSLGACCANPYGWGLLRHVLAYLSSPFILEHVQEFQSPSIRSEGMVVFAVLLLAGAALASRAMARREWFEGVLVLAWGFAALRSARHIPFFALAAAPVVASECALWCRRRAERAGVRSLGRVLWEAGQDLGKWRHASVWIPLMAAAALMASPRAVRFPEARFPVGAVERNAEVLAPPASMPRVLSSDQWSDYLIFRLYPRQRVFFDGRSDFYGPALCADYRALLGAERNWRELMDRYGFELALLPRDWPLGTMLEREPEWERVYQDSVAVLYRRHPARGTRS